MLYIHFTGVGLQWYGDAAVEATVDYFPEKKIMQTETKCGNRDNSWNYAFETYAQLHWYLNRNATAYMQWNMALDQTGKSTWGWKQSAMVTLDTIHRKTVLNPQYYTVKHICHFVQPGAKRIQCSANYFYKLMAFQNPDGSIVCIFINGNPISHEYFKASERKAFQGLCLVVVQSKSKDGEIRLFAESEALQVAELSIQAN